ncbi:tellurite resistance/C4-dicarboxylate transporter family protein [Pseudarthrobacter sp. P1]|uniref:tellurite resistance/C4-dicarboxylate transporter family protein n=1 Tax=Pseudarthrobacter sp. P1 TaxID=3418418 RepID=UPI003CED4B18
MPRQISGTAGRLWHGAVEHLPPNSFAFVMASGIVATALADSGAIVPSLVMSWLAVAGFVVLAVVGVAHLAAHRAIAAQDARDPKRAFGYFTLVAALGVLGAPLYSEDAPWPAVALFAASVPLWALFAYGLPANLMLRPHEDPVSANIDGSWFMWVVGTQSVAVLAVVLAPTLGSWTAPVAVALWGVGIVLYLVLAALILLRLLTVPNTPDSFTPAYWIFTGATAISVLVAARVIGLPHSLPVVAATAGFVAGAAFVLWAFGTWWIPLLVIFGIWRHVVKRRPLRYESGLWSVVFPLGMYAVASMALGGALGLGFLDTIGRAAAVVALLAWTATAAAMVSTALAYVRSIASAG